MATTGKIIVVASLILNVTAFVCLWLIGFVSGDFRSVAQLPYTCQPLNAPTAHAGQSCGLVALHLL